MSYEEQIMSEDKYPIILLKSNGGFCVYNRKSLISQDAESFENFPAPQTKFVRQFDRFQPI